MNLYEVLFAKKLNGEGGGGGGGNTIEDYLNKSFAGSAEYTGTSLPYAQLYGQNGITSLSFPNLNNAVNLSEFAFAHIQNLVSFSAPSLNKCSNNMLRDNPNLTSVNLKTINDTGASTFMADSSLTVLVFPLLNTIYTQAFRDCTSLTTLDVKLGTGISNQNALNGCTSLKTLIIRKTGVPTLANLNNFTGTPFASDGTGGTIYVPSAQISAYQSASNWSTLLGYTNNQIKAIEGSTYETHYADGTVIS